ncbi:hypothetical protein DL96DRAFT_305957 [Flagelloscypha sp. PMI_526]|nr:hypothetical protein DL96DRAFT_305957 [Flagelloscypha sp. PMI_526]
MMWLLSFLNIFLFIRNSSLLPPSLLRLIYASIYLCIPTLCLHLSHWGKATSYTVPIVVGFTLLFHLTCVLRHNFTPPPSVTMSIVSIWETTANLIQEYVLAFLWSGSCAFTAWLAWEVHRHEPERLHGSTVLVIVDVTFQIVAAAAMWGIAAAALHSRRTRGQFLVKRIGAREFGELDDVDDLERGLMQASS